MLYKIKFDKFKGFFIIMEAFVDEDGLYKYTMYTEEFLDYKPNILYIWSESFDCREFK